MLRDVCRATKKKKKRKTDRSETLFLRPRRFYVACNINDADRDATRRYGTAGVVVDV